MRHISLELGSLTLLSMLSKGTWIHMVKSGAHSCRNVHQHLPWKFSLLELRISMKMLMGESYQKECFAPCNSARSLSDVSTTAVLIASTLIIVTMGGTSYGIHLHVRSHRLVGSFPHVTPIILAASI